MSAVRSGEAFSRGLGMPKDVVVRLGDSIPRREAVENVMGHALHSADFRPEGLVHAALASAPIGAGELVSLDVSAARAASGVLLVLTPDTFPDLTPATNIFASNHTPEAPWRVLKTKIQRNGQPVAVVVAEGLEQAVHAAGLVRDEYRTTPPATSLDAPADAPRENLRALQAAFGDVDAALRHPATRLRQQYDTPRTINVPIELHGTTVHWQGDRLTVWEPSQWPDGMARMYATWFGIPAENVTLISSFVGGGFGSKGQPYEYSALAAAAARELDRPVKLILTRAETFFHYGGRAATRQTLEIALDGSDAISGIRQAAMSECSMYEPRTEPLLTAPTTMYDVASFSTHHTRQRLNLTSPGPMRAPGENPSHFGLESAVDELCHERGLDPLAFRTANLGDRDHLSGHPFSSKRLAEAMSEGADLFDWGNRPGKPRSRRDGHWLIGCGMATGSYPTHRVASDARLTARANGRISIECTGIDMGTGTYTILAQAVSETLDVSIDRVDVRLGNSGFAVSPISGGSMLAGAVVGGAYVASAGLRQVLTDLAVSDPRSPFHRSGANEVAFVAGELRAGGKALTIGAFLKAIGREELALSASEFGDVLDRTSFSEKGALDISGEPPHVSRAWGAHFVEVGVDVDFGIVRVRRMVSAFDAGRLYNPRLAHSQFMGGMIMGIGQALMEEVVVDPRNARMINSALAEYVIPVNADIPDLHVISVGQPDYLATPLGGKAVGETGIVGVAPAIANAVFNATGKRIRDLPITLEKVLGAAA